MDQYFTVCTVLKQLLSKENQVGAFLFQVSTDETNMLYTFDSNNKSLSEMQSADIPLSTLTYSILTKIDEWRLINSFSLTLLLVVFTVLL